MCLLWNTIWMPNGSVTNSSIAAVTDPLKLVIFYDWIVWMTEMNSICHANREFRSVVPWSTITNQVLLPPANKVWGKVIFLHLFVILFTVGGSGPGGACSQGVPVLLGGACSSGGCLFPRGCLLQGVPALGGWSQRGACSQRGSGPGGQLLPGGASRPTPKGKLRGIRYRPTPKGEIEGIRSRPTSKREIQGDQDQPPCTLPHPPPPTTTAAGSTHPTGMHSCLRILWWIKCM